MTDVRDFVVRGWAALGPRAGIHFGDLHWIIRADRPSFDPERDVRIWRRAGGEVIGMAWFDGAASGEVAALEFTGPLLASLLDWLESTHLGSEWAADSPHFSVQAWEDDEVLAEALRARGYGRRHAVGHRLLRELAEIGSVTLPPGYRFQQPNDSDNFDSELDLVLSTAFGHPGLFRREMWRSLRKMGGYRDDLAVLLSDPDGHPAAAALCWYDEINRCGEFEPVGVVPGHQGAGLGRFLMAEGLRRLGEIGAATALVGVEAANAPAISLYRSAGFEVVGTRVAFRRELP